MACFVAPATAAIATSLTKKKVPEKYHFDWLIMMYWGGTVMLIIDHILNGEMMWQFPFFTGGYAYIGHEILTVGLPITIGILGLWTLMIFASTILHRQTLKSV
jgi:uncharacterized membrane protein YvlD (DUF360 family)